MEKSNSCFDREEHSLKHLLDALAEIQGYRATAIMTCDGELLYNTAAAPIGNLGPWMAVFNNLFAHTCNLSEASGFLACRQVAMRTGEEIVVIHSSAPDCRAGIRLLVILDHQGNVAAIQQRLDELLPLIMRSLIGDPDNLVDLHLKDLSGAAGTDPCPSGSPGRFAIN